MAEDVNKVLESIERQQWEAISNTEKTLERVVTVLDGMERRMAGMEKQLVSVGRPQWAMLSVMLAAIIAIGTLASVGINAKINNVEGLEKATQQTVASHLNDGHPTSVVNKVDANTSRIEDNLSSMRRELDQLQLRIIREEDRSWHSLILQRGINQ